jgi:methyltransferase (TIGR00027 family)
MKDRPSATALRVAQRRAAHQVVDSPLVFEDPLALRILGEESAEAVRRQPDLRGQTRIGRALRAFLAARSRFAEDALAAALERGVGQYVILGAGLDTSGFRDPVVSRGIRVFEVDHPATQGWKRGLLARAAIPVPDALSFVPLDFETQTLPEALRLGGFDAAQPAFLSWLGVVPYLRSESVTATLAFVASLPEKSTVVFDYGIPPSSLGFFERMAFAHLAGRVAAAGEPWRGFFEPATLRAQLRELGFREIEDLDPDAINERYFAGRTDRFRVGKLGHFARAER